MSAAPVFVRNADGTVSLQDGGWPVEIVVADALLPVADPRLLTQRGADELVLHTRESRATYAALPRDAARPGVQRYACRSVVSPGMPEDA